MRYLIQITCAYLASSVKASETLKSPKLENIYPTLLLHGINDECVGNPRYPHFAKIIKENVKDPNTGESVHVECVDIGGEFPVTISIFERLTK